MGGARGDGGPAIEASSGGADRFFMTVRYEPKARGFRRDAFLDDPNDCPATKSPVLGAWLAGTISRAGDRILDVYAGLGGVSVGVLLSGRSVDAVERDPETARRLAGRLSRAEVYLMEVGVGR